MVKKERSELLSWNSISLTSPDLGTRLHKKYVGSALALRVAIGLEKQISPSTSEVEAEFVHDVRRRASGELLRTMISDQSSVHEVMHRINHDVSITDTDINNLEAFLAAEAQWVGSFQESQLETRVLTPHDAAMIAVMQRQARDKATSLSVSLNVVDDTDPAYNKNISQAISSEPEYAGRVKLLETVEAISKETGKPEAAKSYARRVLDADEIGNSMDRVLKAWETGLNIGGLSQYVVAAGRILHGQAEELLDVSDYRVYPDNNGESVGLIVEHATALLLANNKRIKASPVLAHYIKIEVAAINKKIEKQDVTKEDLVAFAEKIIKLLLQEVPSFDTDYHSRPAPPGAGAIAIMEQPAGQVPGKHDRTLGSTNSPKDGPPSSPGGAVRMTAAAAEEAVAGLLAAREGSGNTLPPGGGDPRVDAVSERQPKPAMVYEETLPESTNFDSAFSEAGRINENRFSMGDLENCLSTISAANNYSSQEQLVAALTTLDDTYFPALVHMISGYPDLLEAFTTYNAVMHAAKVKLTNWSQGMDVNQTREKIAHTIQHDEDTRKALQKFVTTLIERVKDSRPSSKTELKKRFIPGVILIPEFGAREKTQKAPQSQADMDNFKAQLLDAVNNRKSLVYEPVKDNVLQSLYFPPALIVLMGNVIEHNQQVDLMAFYQSLSEDLPGTFAAINKNRGVDMRNAGSMFIETNDFKTEYVPEIILGYLTRRNSLSLTIYTLLRHMNPPVTIEQYPYVGGALKNLLRAYDFANQYLLQVRGQEISATLPVQVTALEAARADAKAQEVRQMRYDRIKTGIALKLHYDLPNGRVGEQELAHELRNTVLDNIRRDSYDNQAIQWEAEIVLTDIDQIIAHPESHYHYSNGMQINREDPEDLITRVEFGEMGYFSGIDPKMKDMVTDYFLAYWKLRQKIKTTAEEAHRAMTQATHHAEQE